ncbi:MAG: hypothetical protein V4665_02290 [Patescibacteria group bacterium]
MMFIQSWGGNLGDSLLSIWYGFMSFVPALLGAIILFIIGWIIGSVVGKAITQVIDALKVDKVFESAGAHEVMNRTGMRLHIGGFIGGLVKWLIVLAFLMASLQILNLTEVMLFLSDRVLSYLGGLLIAVLILIIGFIVANFVKQLVVVSAKAMNAPSANFLGSLARYAIIVFAFAIALPKILLLDSSIFFNLLISFIQPLIWAVALAFALAFGLGGRDVASRSIEKFTKEMSGKNNNSTM